MRLSLHWHGAEGLYTVKNNIYITLACAKQRKENVEAVCVSCFFSFFFLSSSNRVLLSLVKLHRVGFYYVAKACCLN